jgi:hypothetical protein
MNEELYIAFENYLYGEMSPEARLELENQLRKDIDIREKFEIYKETTQFLSAKFDPETLDFKKNLETISAAHFAEKHKDKSKIIVFKPWYMPSQHRLSSH